MINDNFIISKNIPNEIQKQCVNKINRLLYSNFDENINVIPIIPIVYNIFENFNFVFNRFKTNECSIETVKCNSCDTWASMIYKKEVEEDEESTSLKPCLQQNDMFVTPEKEMKRQRK